jgi:hypothetical protein
VAFRILAFQAGAVTDARLSPNVFGNRLEKPTAWSTRLPSTAWGEFRDYQLLSLSEHRWRYTCLSDIAGFYPNIDIVRLCVELRRLGVPQTIAGPLERLLVAWHQGKSQLVGLPVGGQGSGVLSNAYLSSLGDLLHSIAADFAMYGDDFAIFDRDPARGQAVMEAVDNHLSGLLGLQRNLGKTKEFLDAFEAAAHVENSALSYLASVEETADDASTELLYDFWDGDVLGSSEPNVSETHFILGKLSKRRDPYAVQSLLARRDLIALDPKSVIDYIRTTSPDSEAVAEVLCGMLAMPATPTTEAVHLHICRYLAAANHSPAIGAIVERMVDSTSRYRGPTRAMAVQARVRCPGWRFDDLIERADPEPEFCVRRSLVGATKSMVDRPRTKRLALRDLARRDRSLIPTAAWAVAA